MNGSNLFFTVEDFGEYLSVPKSSVYERTSTDCPESTRISTSANTFASIRIRPKYDPVAADAVCVRALGFNPRRVKYIYDASFFLGNVAGYEVL